MRCDGIMASGFYAFDGACACPEIYPFGTEYFVGECKYVCLDRGYALEDGRTDLDLWFEDRQKALDFGIQKIRTVIIVKRTLKVFDNIKYRRLDERLQRTTHDYGGDVGNSRYEHARHRGFR